MQTKYLYYLVGTLLLFPFLSGCNDSNGNKSVSVLSDGGPGIDDEDTSTEIISKLSGSYDLKETLVTFDDGSKVQLSAQNGELNGQMDISDSGSFTQVITVVSLDKTFRAKATIQDANKDYIRITSKQCTYNLLYDYSVSSEEIRLTTIVKKEAVCGENDFEEQDVWVKDMTTNKKRTTLTANTKNDIRGANAGGIIAEITKPY